MVFGQGEIEGRPAVVQGDDFTVRGGAADAAIWQKMVYAERLAHDLRLPLVRLVDGTGGGGSVKSLETMGHTYVPFVPGMELAIANLARVPVVAAALGPVAGLGAARVVASHFSVIVRGTVAAVRRRPAGGGRRDGRVARQGGARRLARADARGRRRQRGGRRGRRARPAPALPLLPARRTCGSCRRSLASTDPPDRREEALLSIVPRDPRQPYDMRAILDAVCDRGSVFELGARHGRSLICALARLDGRPVGVLASDPKHYGGGLTGDASDKLVRFVDLCDQFRLPGRQPRRPAGLRDRLGRRARRHDAPRRARAVRRPPGDGAVGVRARAQGLRRRRRLARRPLAAQPPLRVAVGRLGLAADRGRARGRLPARARGGRRTRSRCAPRSRRGSTRCARRSAPPSASASRRSSTRATRGRCCARGRARRTALVAHEAGGGPKARGPRP